MADVGLDGPDQQRLVPSSAVGRSGGLGLDRVADRRAGAVSLHIVDLRRLHAGPGQRVGDDPLLGFAVGDGEPLAGAVLVQGRPPDHSPDPVAVGLGVGQSLQDQDPASLAPHVAVGGRVEGLAPPVGGQHPGIAPQLEQPTGQDGVDPAGQGQVGLAPLKSGHRLMHGRQRRRAGGVDGQSRSLQPEREGDPPDGGVERGSGYGIEAGRRLGSVVAFQHQGPVLVVAYACVHAGAAALETVRVDSGVLQRMPAHFQHEPLLGIQQLRLHRRYPEEGGVELVDLVDEGPEPAGVVLGGGAGEQFANPAHPRSRNALGYGARACFEQPPESSDVRRAREPARHADHRNGRTVRPRRRVRQGRSAPGSPA